MASVKKHIYHYAPNYINESEKFNHTSKAKCKEIESCRPGQLSLPDGRGAGSVPLPPAAQVGSGLCSPH